MDKFVYRVLDANFNRAREGLRVSEEFVRFYLNDTALTEEFKKARALISRLYNGLPDKKARLFLARDTAGDVGRSPFKTEMRRSGRADIFWANIQRSKEAVRVLEEFSKLDEKALSNKLRALRYKLYELEKKAFKKLGK